MDNWTCYYCEVLQCAVIRPAPPWHTLVVKRVHGGGVTVETAFEFGTYFKRNWDRKLETI